MRAFIVNMLFLVLSVTVHAQTARYVSPNGSDTDNDCSDPANPCGTIQYTINIANPGDFVELTAGVFTNVDTFLVIIKPLQIRGAGQEVTIIQGAETIEEAAHGVIAIVNADSVSLEHLTVRHGNTPSPVYTGGGIYCANTRLRIDHCVIRDNISDIAGGIATWNQARVELVNSRLVQNVARWRFSAIEIKETCRLVARHSEILDHPDLQGNNTTGTINLNPVMDACYASFDSCVIANNVSGGFECLGGVPTSPSQLTIDHSLIMQNGPGINGIIASGIAFNDENVTLMNSTICQNESELGAGISWTVDQLNNSLPDTIRIINTTISGNHGRRTGGANLGIDEQMVGSMAILDNVTITGNTTAWSGRTDGGLNACCQDSVIKVKNSIIAGNTNVTTNQPADCRGVVASHGYNLVGSLNGCELIHMNNSHGVIIGQDPLLSDLWLWGGFTPVHLPLPGSPAIDAGDCWTIDGELLLYDQRGYPRPYGDDCDIGAVERQAEEVDIETPDPTPVHLPLVPYLEQNYPNPFNIGQGMRQTTISYYVTPAGIRQKHIRLTVYNTAGQRVRTLVDTKQGPGLYDVTWDGRNSSGQIVASGVYFYRLELDTWFSEQKRLVLLR